MSLFNGVMVPPFEGNFSPIRSIVYEDGLTIERKLKYLSTWINTELVGHLNANVDGIIEAVDKAVSDVQIAIANNELEVDGKIAELNDQFNAVVQQIINSSIEVQDSVVAGMLKDPTTEAFKTAKSMFERLRTYNVLDYGIVGDGSKDDTVAFQELINSVPRGSTIVIPPSKNGARWMSLTGTITVTTESLKIIGPSAYHYNGGIVFTGIGVPVFVIKASGFQLEKMGFIGRSDYGDSATNGYQIGLDFYGGVLGDVDSWIDQCAFTGFGTAIVTRGRNLKVTNSLFGAVRIAWDQLGKTPAYHDTSRLNIVRGMIFNNNRLHGSGKPGYGLIQIREHTDYRHGSIKGNYIDNNCPGTFVTVTGTDLNKIRNLTVRDNDFYEGFNSFIEANHSISLDVIDNVIDNAGGAPVFDSISVKNSDSVKISGNRISRAARNAISIENTPLAQIDDNRASLSGYVIMGHALAVIGEGSAGLVVKGLVAEGATGNGINGSPDSGTVDSCKLRTTGKAIESKTLKLPAITIPATAMVEGTGNSPVLNVKNFPVRVMASDSARSITSYAGIPAGALQVEIEVIFATLDEGSGTVDLQIGRNVPISNLGQSNSSGSVQKINVDGMENVYRARNLVSANATDVIGVRVIRLTTGTYVGRIGIMAVNVTQYI